MKTTEHTYPTSPSEVVNYVRDRLAQPYNWTGLLTAEMLHAGRINHNDIRDMFTGEVGRMDGETLYELFSIVVPGPEEPWSAHARGMRDYDHMLSMVLKEAEYQVTEQVTALEHGREIKTA